MRAVIIDDEPLVCANLSELLSDHGYEVSIAHDGLEGVKLVKKFSPMVVVTDVVMPNMDGLEFIMELRKTNAELKVIAMSGGGRNMNFDYLSAAKTFGADVVLYKPFQEEDLLKAVEQVLPKPNRQ